MKLRSQVRDVPTETNLFQPWERLLLVSVELDTIDTPGLRELADACFAVVKHMAGRASREDAYRSVRRALDVVRELAKPRGDVPELGASPAPIQARLPLETTTVTISREAFERIERYARERGLDFETAVERLLRMAERRRSAVNKWNRKGARA